jgi:hypothetical protein
MISIQNSSILLSEINRNQSNLGFSRSKVVDSGEEYSLGRNKNFFKVNIIGKFPIFKNSLELFITKDKLIELESLYTEQHSSRVYNYNIGDDIRSDVLYTYYNPSTKSLFCFIEYIEVLDSFFSNAKIIYKIKLDIIEI